MHCYQFPWRWFFSATVHKKHEMREPSVACREPQPQPQHQERPPTKRRKGTTDVIVEATGTLKAVADMAGTVPQPVRGDQYSALATHIAAELREMDNVGSKIFTTAASHGLQWYLMDRWDLLHLTTQEARPSTSGYIQAALQQAGIEENTV
ncbi:uncharacterized protein LOC126427341 isoform X2 [Schistocerca serialis cubense]|uniref:uncharacterized protein LOC126427341 isoform X2 n=1 Tax=Schistocerca serialis cubense TaxID=2023355 RepID=UPI00214E6B43|nr:uncharacterized protein LOC126427341 isoform X2 [Schistocerca serialis cubense]